MDFLVIVIGICKKYVCFGFCIEMMIINSTKCNKNSFLEISSEVLTKCKGNANEFGARSAPFLAPFIENTNEIQRKHAIPAREARRNFFGAFH